MDEPNHTLKKDIVMLVVISSDVSKVAFVLLDHRTCIRVAFPPADITCPQALGPDVLVMKIDSYTDAVALSLAALHMLLWTTAVRSLMRSRTQGLGLLDRPCGRHIYPSSKRRIFPREQDSLLRSFIGTGYIWLVATALPLPQSAAPNQDGTLSSNSGTLPMTSPIPWSDSYKPHVSLIPISATPVEGEQNEEVPAQSNLRRSLPSLFIRIPEELLIAQEIERRSGGFKNFFNGNGGKNNLGNLIFGSGASHFDLQKPPPQDKGGKVGKGGKGGKGPHRRFQWD
ncbi:hypothetical protein K474DRAFT_1676559 [Panus rudis PR-1116 ss-1]|nr:hypothetical protein K474DRAFT_1676559 [Panus rudis PR-1116 ss-1]